VIGERQPYAAVDVGFVRWVGVLESLHDALQLGCEIHDLLLGHASAGSSCWLLEPGFRESAAALGLFHPARDNHGVGPGFERGAVLTQLGVALGDLALRGLVRLRLVRLAVQLVPNIAHAGLLGGFAIAQHAAYVETAVAGQVFEVTEIISDLLTRFDTLRNEALRKSESLALIERMCEEWKASGARAATQATTAESA
jgi:hypothetical protein